MPNTIYATATSDMMVMSFFIMSCARSGLTKKAEPRRSNDVDRECGTESATRRWLRRLVELSRCAAGKRESLFFDMAIRDGVECCGTGCHRGRVMKNNNNNIRPDNNPNQTPDRTPRQAKNRPAAPPPSGRPDSGRRGPAPTEYNHRFPSMKRFADLLALRYDMPRTRHSYYRQIGLILKHFDADPATLTEEQLRDYILHVKLRKHWKPKTMRQCAACARLFFIDMLGHGDWTVFSQLKVRAHYELPAVMTREEVVLLLSPMYAEPPSATRAFFRSPAPTLPSVGKTAPMTTSRAPRPSPAKSSCGAICAMSCHADCGRSAIMASVIRRPKPNARKWPSTPAVRCLSGRWKTRPQNPPPSIRARAATDR